MRQQPRTAGWGQGAQRRGAAAGKGHLLPLQLLHELGKVRALPWNPRAAANAAVAPQRQQHRWRSAPPPLQLIIGAAGGGGGGGISCTKKSLRINFPEESTGPGGQAGHGKDAEDAAVAPQVALSRHTAEKTLWRSTNSTLQHAFQGAAYSLRTCTSNAALGRLHCHC